MHRIAVGADGEIHRRARVNAYETRSTSMQKVNQLFNKEVINQVTGARNWRRCRMLSSMPVCGMSLHW